MNRPPMDLGRAQAMTMDSEDCVGWCCECGEESDPIEPDAEGYDCEVCKTVGSVTSLLRVWGLV